MTDTCVYGSSRRTAQIARPMRIEQHSSFRVTASRRWYCGSLNPDLEFTGLYVDDGSSGTNVAGREGFKLMMQEAYAGRFEQIFTKSVSRFARNIIDCLAYTEELKKLGINVFFEAEGLNSMGSTSSIILVVLAMAAQEESHSKSKNHHEAIVSEELWDLVEKRLKKNAEKYSRKAAREGKRTSSP